jgi:hypothetical protein
VSRCAIGYNVTVLILCINSEMRRQMTLQTGGFSIQAIRESQR